MPNRNRVPASRDTIIFFLLVLPTGRVGAGADTENICRKTAESPLFSCFHYSLQGGEVELTAAVPGSKFSRRNTGARDLMAHRLMPPISLDRSQARISPTALLKIMSACTAGTECFR